MVGAKDPSLPLLRLVHLNIGTILSQLTSLHSSLLLPQYVEWYYDASSSYYVKDAYLSTYLGIWTYLSYVMSMFSVFLSLLTTLLPTFKLLMICTTSINLVQMLVSIDRIIITLTCIRLLLWPPLLWSRAIFCLAIQHIIFIRVEYSPVNTMYYTHDSYANCII